MKNNYFILTLLSLLLSTSLSIAQTTVSGKVTEASSGEGLPGVNVVVKGTINGTLTDINGNFSLSAEQGDFLVFSYVGFRSQEVEVGTTTTFNISMSEDFTSLEEVIVTGIASSVKRSNLANAVSTVSAKELTGATSVQTLDGALQGKLTGANIISNSGAPGGGISVKLRGITTITGSSEPLYIVDGVYMDNSSFSGGSNPVTQARSNGEVTDEQDNPSNRIADLNPDDIENIEILKGASASSIYGARANAGVVIITTKRGKNGKTNISFKQDFGVASILNPLGPRPFTEQRIRDTYFPVGDDETAKETADRIAAADAEVAKFRNNPFVDYEDEIYGEKAFLSNTNLSVSGGNEKTKFFVSGALKDEDGIISNTGYKKRSIRANIDHKISEVFDFSINTNFINSEADRAVTNNDNAGVSLGVALTSTRPWDNLFPDENGLYPNNPNAASNPLQTRDLSTNNETTNRMLAGAGLNVNILRKDNTFLKLALRGGLDNFTNKTTIHFPENLQFIVGQLNGFYSRGNNTVLNTNSSAFLVFNTSTAGWELTSQAGVSRLSFDQERLTTQATQLIGAQTNLQQGTISGIFNKNLKTEDIGYSFQQEANWKDRLIATAGIRFDKSSLNGDPNELFGYPKLSVAANLHNFDFFSFDGVNQLKLRVAYGEAGGVPNPNSNDLALASQTIFQGINVEGTPGSLIGDTRGNPEIKPERSKEFETGVDIGIFDSRVSLGVTYYKKTVEDLILRAEVATSQGFEFQTLNAGELENNGWEFSLSSTPIQNSDITWNTRIGWWRNRSEVTQLNIPTFTTGAFSAGLGQFRIEEGQSATQIVGPIPGSTGSVKIGDAEPDFQMSWSNDITFLKNFTFSMLWHWKRGGENINLTSLLTDFGGTSYDYDEDADGNGVPNGPQRISALVGDISDASQFVEEASYIKLREVSLYYTIPKTLMSNITGKTLEYVKLGVSGNNLILISDYTSYDPEVSNFGNDGVSSGVEVTPFPTSKRVFFHLAIGF